MGISADTLEVRWFRTGPLPRTVAGWFLQAGVPASTESRTDVYLAMPGRVDMGVKVRGGTLLELKLRTRVHARPGLMEGLDGRVESWTKWGFALHPVHVLPEEGRSDWIRVEKTRRSRFYGVFAAKGCIRAVASRDLPAENGCTVELVEVRVGAEVAWGVGFEAFGTSPDLLAVLIAGMKACVNDTPLGALEFTIRDSDSYPAFLSRWPPR